MKILRCLDVAQAAKLEPGRRSGAEFLFRCPRHDDQHPSLKVNPDKNAWLCGPCCKGGNAWELAAFLMGVSPEDKVAVTCWLKDHGLLNGAGAGSRPVAEYPYRDGSGALLFEVVRFQPKSFRQRRPDGNGGWIWNLAGVRIVPYRLNQWKDNPWVTITEGEKDADNLWKLGIPATTNPMGAGKWRPEYNGQFAEKSVAILPDNDAPGEAHAREVAQQLFPVAKAVKIVRLPGLPPKGDVSDWLAVNGTDDRKQLILRIIKETPPLTQADIDSWSVPAAAEVSEQTQDSSASWPVLAQAAYCGLAGDIVSAIDPYTEADPVSVLLHLLTAFGNVVGPGPHFRISNDNHPPRLFVAIIGDSSKSRKGTTWGPLREIFSRIDQEYIDKRVRSGLSSGEGLIYHLRDARNEDCGEVDKRLLCIEEEFSSMLIVMSREGNQLSGVVRHAWDRGTLSTLTKKEPLTATGGHVSIIGHTTRDELLRHLSRTEQANGFGNRFLWLLARRSKLLPDGASVPGQILDELAGRLKGAVEFARKVETVRRDATANELWRRIYGDLSAGRPGLLGAMLNRAEAQVLRLGLTFALMDSSLVVTVDHMKAALAVWDYCDTSVRFVFGEASGNPDADRILEALRQSPEQRMTDEEIHRGVFGNHGGHRKAAALAELERLGCVKRGKGESTGGRLPTVWALAS